MINLQQLQRVIKPFAKIVDQEIDTDGDLGFLLVLNDGYNWDAGDPGSHTRGWHWEDATISDIKASLKEAALTPCDGSCGSEGCQ
jgi:hypothetical protein